MSTGNWILLVIGGFLVLYAAQAISRSGKSEDGKRRESLGCGFVVLAAAFWGIALARYLNDWSAGLRLGAALALVLPVLATLLSGGRGRIVASVVMLALAVAFGASAAPKLLDRVKPSSSRVTVQEIEAAVAELKAQIEKTGPHIKKLEQDEKALKSQIRELDFPDFAAITEDARGYALLRELDEIGRMMAAAGERKVANEALLIRMEGAARRVQRRAEAEATGSEINEEEIRAILEEARRKPSSSTPATVEEHVEREQLKRLFEGGL